MKEYYRQIMLVALIGLMANLIQAQTEIFNDAKVGVYISSRAVSYDEKFYLPIAQFVTQDDDAAWSGRLKSEFLIRLGWMFTEQLQPLVGADTVYFMNADLPMGRTMQEVYNPDLRTLDRNAQAIRELDYVLVLDEFAMETRNHRSVYIRSNRMITENIPIKTASFQVSMFDMSNQQKSTDTRVCLDDMNSPTPTYWHFDFFRTTSGMGKFLSKVFSSWWDLMLSGESSDCGEE